MKKLILISISTFPLLALAQGGRASLLINYFTNIVKALIPLTIAIALLVFFWGIIKYLFTDAKEKGSKLMIWGIIAIFVMVSVWGLVRFLQGEFLTGISFDPPPASQINPLH